MGFVFGEVIFYVIFVEFIVQCFVEVDVKDFEVGVGFKYGYVVVVDFVYCFEEYGGFVGVFFFDEEVVVVYFFVGDDFVYDGLFGVFDLVGCCGSFGEGEVFVYGGQVKDGIVGFEGVGYFFEDKVFVGFVVGVGCEGEVGVEDEDGGQGGGGGFEYFVLYGGFVVVIVIWGGILLVLGVYFVMVFWWDSIEDVVSESFVGEMLDLRVDFYISFDFWMLCYFDYFKFLGF